MDFDTVPASNYPLPNLVNFLNKGFESYFVPIQFDTVAFLNMLPQGWHRPDSQSCADYGGSTLWHCIDRTPRLDQSARSDGDCKGKTWERRWLVVHGTTD